MKNNVSQGNAALAYTVADRMSDISGDINFPADIPGIRYPEYPQTAGAGGKEPARPANGISTLAL
ncbi:hypothetical protein [Erwinia sp. JUb26]|uniref:hypothetical protein n=1 Tax=Erwinia sp. JUb26 TaxID=2485126 RepID=UPI0011CDB406|nr:hypothetical protein [Erwinia sp. JUb26]